MASFNTSVGGIPACTASSSSRCNLKPASESVPVSMGIPALYSRPTSLTIFFPKSRERNEKCKMERLQRSGVGAIKAGMPQCCNGFT